MIVSELIAKLDKCDPDAPIVLGLGEFKEITGPVLTITGVVVLGEGSYANEVEEALFNALDVLPESLEYEVWNETYHQAEEELRTHFNSIRPEVPTGFIGTVNNV